MDEERVEAYLDKLDLHPVDRGRYWLIRCPRHEDRQPSAQCFKDDGFIQCHAGCGRFHINEIARERGDALPMPNKYSHISHAGAPRSDSKPKNDRTPVVGNFTDLWLNLEPLANDTDVKGVPALELNKRGWRKFPGGSGLPGGIFIPYFDTTRTVVRFYQIRHPNSERRFSFAPGITPICYGMEQLPKCKRYLCFTEGSRDSVILGMAGVPAIALPSASSDKLLDGLAGYCLKHQLQLVAIGDRDEAGEALLSKLSIGALDFRTPIGKDVGDFFEEKGIEAVKKYYEMFRVDDIT